MVIDLLHIFSQINFYVLRENKKKILRVNEKHTTRLHSIFSLIL